MKKHKKPKQTQENIKSTKKHENLEKNTEIQTCSKLLQNDIRGPPRTSEGPPFNLRGTSEDLRGPRREPQKSTFHTTLRLVAQIHEFS